MPRRRCCARRATPIARAKLSGRIELRHGLAEDVTPGFFGADAAVRPRDLFLQPLDDPRLAGRAPGRGLGGTSRRAASISWISAISGRCGRLPGGRCAPGSRLFHVTPRDELLKLLERERQAGRVYELSVLPGPICFHTEGRAAEVLGICFSRPVAD